MNFCPTLIYEHKKQKSDKLPSSVLSTFQRKSFEDSSISEIEQLTFNSIKQRYLQLSVINHIDLSKLKIWIVISNSNKDENINLSSLELNNLKLKLKESIGIIHVEINCMLLSKNKLTFSDNVISSLKKVINTQEIQYLVLLNNNNFNSIVKNGNNFIQDETSFEKVADLKKYKNNQNIVSFYFADV